MDSFNFVILAKLCYNKFVQNDPQKTGMITVFEGGLGD